jgi:hypothetical protein
VLATTLVLQQGQSCCITGSSSSSSRTILLPPQQLAAAAAEGNNTASLRLRLHFNLTGGRLMLRNLTVSGYTGGNSRGGGGVLIQRAAVGAGDVYEVTPASSGATLVADNVTFRQVHTGHALRHCLPPLCACSSYGDTLHGDTTSMVECRWCF